MHLESTQLPRIAFSSGDPGGIGPEVILKALLHKNLMERFIPLVYGNAHHFTQVAKRMGLPSNIIISVDNETQGLRNHVNILGSKTTFGNISIGRPSPENAHAAIHSLEAACAAVKEEKAHALLTGPIHKQSVMEAGFGFPGHTEFLKDYFKSREVLMVMVAEKLRIAVVTGHIPLSDVADALTAELLQNRLDVLARALRERFHLTKPNIAVLGLNPHAGEEGQLGNEENTILRPVLAEAGKRFPNARLSGPFPADGFFGMQQGSKYDAVLAMYHDQGLIPFKTLSFGKGVNFTAGLPIIRTSPDHGTAFDIAEKNTASSESMEAAITLCLQMFS